MPRRKISMNKNSTKKKRRSRFGEDNVSEVCGSLRDELKAIKSGTSGEEVSKLNDRMIELDGLIKEATVLVRNNLKIFKNHKRILETYVTSNGDKLKEGWANEFDNGELLIENN